MKKTISSIDAKIIKFSYANNMKLNGYPWHKLFNASESIVEEVSKYSLLTIGEYHKILDKHTEPFKNPENWAIRAEASEDLQILGYVFGESQVFRTK